MTEEEINLSWIKNNPEKIIVIFMFLLAVAGIWLAWNTAWIKGATTICENSGGYPVIIDAEDIKDGQCLIEYDPLSLHDNNLGLDQEKVEKLKKLVEDDRR